MDRGDVTARVLRAREGSRADLDALLRRHAGKLLALIRLRMGPQLRGSLESRDVLQNTLLKAFEGIEDFQGQDRDTFMAWLARIAHNEIRDQASFHHAQRRDQRNNVPLSDAVLVATVRTATRRVALGEQAHRLESAIEALADDQRQVIVLRKLHERSFPEIGAILDRSPDACRMLFARAMTALTMQLETAP